MLAVVCGALLVYWACIFFYKYQISLKLVNETVPYQKLSTDYSKTLLVLGDSTGVGVGAEKAEDSVAGRLAKTLDATYVENRAVSGAVVADLPMQFAQASLERYDTILIQIGGNDITHFHDAQKTADALAPLLAKAVSRSTQVILMSAGNVGATTNFPPFVRPFYTRLNLQYHEAFGTVAKQERAVYVNLYTPPGEDPFTAHPETYLAADGFHPSGAGYGLWFDRLKETIPSL